MKITLFAVVGIALAGCGTPGEICNAKRLGGPFCIPDSGIAAAGQKLTFEVVDQCTGGCGRVTLDCEVTRDAGTLTLAIVGQVCLPPAGAVCNASCALTRMKCELPALEEGDYTVVSPDQTSKALMVRDGGQAACDAPLF